MVKLKYLLVIFLILALVIPLIVVNRYIYSYVSVSCYFESNRITYGGRVDYVCYGIYNVSVGRNTYIINLRGPRDIVEAYLSLIDVESKFVSIDITGALRPSERITHIISIPRDAYSISVKATVRGIPKDGIYPSGVYIIGGNYPLYCNVSCVYNSAVIIDRPGDYVLEVFSGTGGNGINYTIQGGYYVRPSYVTISLNNNILYRANVTSTEVITLPGLRENNILYVDVEGIPNFRILLRVVQRCSLSGSAWSCIKYIPSENKSITRVVCTINLNSSCDISDIFSEIPFNVKEATYLKDAYNVKVLLNGMLTDTDISTLYRVAPFLLLKGIGYGNNVLEVMFDVPYIIAGAQESIGSCIINPMSVNIVAVGGMASTTLTIRNIERNPIEIYIYAYPEDIIVVSPNRVIIPPNSNAEIQITAKQPGNGYITIVGCAQTEVKIPVNIQIAKTELWIVIFVFVIVATLSFILYIRKR